MYGIMPIRSPDDICYLAHVDSQSFDDPVEYEDWQRWSNRYKFLIATFRETPVGYLSFDVHRDKVFLIRLAVHKKHRRLGLASSLIRRVITHSDRPIVTFARESWIYRDNCAAGNLFKKLGFSSKLVKASSPEFPEDGIQFIKTPNQILEEIHGKSRKPRTP